MVDKESSQDRFYDWVWFASPNAGRGREIGSGDGKGNGGAVGVDIVLLQELD